MSVSELEDICGLLALIRLGVILASLAVFLLTQLGFAYKIHSQRYRSKWQKVIHGFPNFFFKIKFGEDHHNERSFYTLIYFQLFFELAWVILEYHAYSTKLNRGDTTLGGNPDEFEHTFTPYAVIYLAVTSVNLFYKFLTIHVVTAFRWRADSW
eukprot:CAMPEP_0115039736 /NCGR_PEP_ID=MMETSP0216-20121206/44304_1 /TAXON_ID=223996 /ORGANISM="Protocruzia adherens, Strain Boccale" /LENGTH=153 /DNA_ID=CAMNT_0002420629 /DNA_START=36 /DNA_END=494 /DNA_ORIENTATION=+